MDNNRKYLKRIKTEIKSAKKYLTQNLVRLVNGQKKRVYPLCLSRKISGSISSGSFEKKKAKFT